MRATSPQGTVLVSSLAVLLGLTIIAILAMTFAIFTVGRHQREANLLVARHLAEMGIQDARTPLDSITELAAGWERTAPNGGIYRVFGRSWGPFVQVRSEGVYRNQHAHVAALLGANSRTIATAALRNCDPSYPLVIAGNSRIDGDIHVSSRGLMTGRLEGSSAPDSGFHHGHVIIKHDQVQSIDTAIWEQMSSESGRRERSSGTVILGTLLLTARDTLRFDTDTLLRAEDNIVLIGSSLSSPVSVTTYEARGYVEISSGARLSGLFEIHPGSYIKLRDTVALDGALITAKDSIVLESNARFSGVAVCPGRIVLRDRAMLVPPAILVTRCTDRPDEDSAGIFLSSSAPMEGVCWVEGGSSLSESPLLFVDSGVAFTGLLVSSGRADIRGKLRGGMVIRRFEFASGMTTYVNWLRDVQVDRRALDYNPVLPVLANRQDSVLEIVRLWR